MRRVFADSGYWIALIDPADALHDRAIKSSSALRPLAIITHDLVFVEVLDHFSGFGARYRDAAVKVINAARVDNHVRIVDMSSERFHQAVLRYDRFRDKEWAATDCYSFALMDDHGLTEALATTIISCRPDIVRF